MKNTLKGINSSITEAEEHTSGWKDRIVEITAIEQNRETRKKMKTEISNLPGKEFKALVIRMLTELGKKNR